MLFTEVLVKFLELPEDFSMLVNLRLNQDYKNPSLHVISHALMMLWVVYTLASIKEEVKLSKKNLYKEHQSVS